MARIYIIVNVDWFFLSHRKDLAIAAQKAGYDVTIITNDTGRKEEILGLGLKMINLPMDRTGTNLFKELKTFLFLFNLYRKEKPTIIHHVGLKVVLIGSLAAKLARISCEQYLNTLYGVYDDANEINLDSLPQKFVIKTTDGGGGENVFICRDKSSIDFQNLANKINNWRNKQVSNMTKEWAYEGAKESKIIIEKYLEDPLNDDHSIDDYKFFCFDGKVKYLVVDVDRYSGHKRNFYTRDWKPLNVSSDCPVANRSLTKPAGYEEMVTVAETLSSGFPFVRVDLYNIENKTIFGEMTFYPWSGYVQFAPDSFDYELGKFFNINY